MRLSMYATLFLLLWVPFHAMAQESIAVQIISGAVMVPVQINDLALNFLLDTGSEGSSIDSSRAAEFESVPHGTQRIEKNFRSLVVPVIKIPSMEVGNTKFKQVDLTEENLAPLSKALGTSVDGVLGTDILETFAFKLSYSAHSLVIGPLKKLGTLGDSIALNRFGNQFLIEIAFMSVPGELVLDTGTNSTNVSWKTWERLSRVWIPKETVQGIARAGNPTSQAMLICVPKVGIGAVLLKDQAVRAQEKVVAGAFSSENFGGILGSDILRRFEITFDLHNNVIFLKPDTNYKSDPYRYVTIGIQIAKNDAGIFQIMSVWKDSPAAEVGLQSGDLIKAVNGHPLESLTAEQVSSKLHAKEGTTLRLGIERNAEPSTIIVKTRALLCAHEQSRLGHNKQHPLHRDYGGS